MKKRILTGIVLGTILVSNVFAACNAEKSDTRPGGLSGGSYDNCTSEGCHPNVPGEVSATRHHVMDKQFLIDRLNTALSGSNDTLKGQATDNIVEILKAMGAVESVIADFESDGECSDETNSYLTWLTPNLVLGPRPEFRSADPENDFDIWVFDLIPNPENQNAIHDIIYQGSPNDLADAFSKLEVRANPYNFVGDEWTGNKKGERIVYCPTTIYNIDNECPNFIDYA